MFNQRRAPNAERHGRAGRRLRSFGCRRPIFSADVTVVYLLSKYLKGGVRRILQIYFSVAHDPTQLNRQGPDTGTQYRSAIFTENEEQAKIAKAYIVQLNQAGVFNATIVTKVTQLQGFYAAENYHQNFLVAHPNHPYIVINDIPKIENLLRVYPDIYRADPVLVATVGVSN
jgi:peptide-methionine (S)-S-oxide reductase